MSGNFLCLISALVLQIVLLLDTLQLLMLFVRTLAYLEAKLFLLILHNCSSQLLIITLIIFIINAYIYPHRSWYECTNCMIAKIIQVSSFCLCVCVSFLVHTFKLAFRLSSKHANFCHMRDEAHGWSKWVFILLFTFHRTRKTALADPNAGGGKEMTWGNYKTVQTILKL
jgi:hypothetical protein